MNLMIVEDEPILRNNLANNIAWDEIGVEVIAVAASSEEAMNMYDRKKPDLVLLDIQMSGASGLDLAAWIRERDELVRMIVLSGHDNFEFARRALELGIRKYLLKPAGESEIKRAVAEAADELRQVLDERHNYAVLQQRWAQHLPFVRLMFLSNWLQGHVSSWELRDRSKEVLLDIEALRLFCVAVIDMDPLPEEETRFTSKDASLLQFSVRAIAREVLEPYADWIVTMPNGYTAVVFTTADAHAQPQTFTQEVNANVRKLLTVIHQSLKLTASAGISRCTVRPEELAKLYEQARQALQQRILYGNHIAVTYLEHAEEEKAVNAQPEHELERELTIALETGNRTKAAETLDRLWHAVMDGVHTVDQVYEGVLYFMTLFVRLIQQRGYSVKEVVGDDIAYLHNVQAFATKEQVRACLERMLSRMLEYWEHRRGAAGHKMVEAALRMIDDNLREDLTLHSVAERLYINSSYLSRLFKQETGKSFSAYVLERKMEQAKRVLLEGAKVYDAAEAAGYRDVSYFTKVFRKYWGVTPGEIAKA
jgi:two-component system response regulator YesN